LSGNWLMSAESGATAQQGRGRGVSPLY
jgi:hypothetical protein